MKCVPVYAGNTLLEVEAFSVTGVQASWGSHIGHARRGTQHPMSPMNMTEGLTMFGKSLAPRGN